MLPNVSSRDIGNPTSAGEYCVNDKYFKVDKKHVAAWEEDPDALFRTVLCTRMGDDRIRFALSSRLDT